MLAVDTNILIRFFTNDDSAQLERVRLLFEANDVAVSLTVLLETEWVLRKLYRLSSGAISSAFMLLSGLPMVHIQQRELAISAIALMANGMDFADALHVVQAQGMRGFVTFDQRLIRRARNAGLHHVRAP